MHLNTIPHQKNLWTVPRLKLLHASARTFGKRACVQEVWQVESLQRFATERNPATRNGKAVNYLPAAGGPKELGGSFHVESPA